MSFFSLYFVLFFFVVLASMYFVKTSSSQARIIFVANIVFYVSWDSNMVALLLILCIITHICSAYIANKIVFSIGAICPVIMLAVFKYYNFFVNSFCDAIGKKTMLEEIIVPIGISFFCFLAISYLLDLRQGLISRKSFIVLFSYIAFFPTIICGPITKARDLVPQFENYKGFCWDNINRGIQCILCGCIKKYVLADNIAVFVDSVYAHPQIYDSATTWWAVCGYSCQLYYDFSGYSDIAIGIALCMGYRVAENFNVPYLAQNISDFWKRWHMSLSNWLQEYLYFRLGGNRCSKVKQYYNLFVTMFICGLWHGAGINFALWGGVHGICLILHKCYSSHNMKFRIPLLLKVLGTFVIVTICWIPFRLSKSEDIMCVISKLFFVTPDGISVLNIWNIIGVTIMVCTSLFSCIVNNGEGKRIYFDVTTIKGLTCVMLQILIVLSFMYTGASQFVYANF